MDERRRTYTRSELIAYAVRKYRNHQICTDRIDEAMEEIDIAKAADILILDTEYWDS